jgi:DNA polymerase-3 subunit delta'
MAFKDFPRHQQGIELLQRSLERKRLAHAYLFSGHQLEELEALARTLAQTINCQRPRQTQGQPVDCCDQCASCRKIVHLNHADIHWVRPESKTRIIKVEQIRELNHEINLKPTEARYKVGIIVAADRLKTEAANAFLKTLEEPPPQSILLLLTTEPQRILETLLSRCLRLSFGGDSPRPLEPAQLQWLGSFSEMAAAEHKSLLSRYRLLDVLLSKLNEMKAGIEQALTARSPLRTYKEAEKDLQDKWEDELAAAIEAEYRRQRSDLLGTVQWWLRDVWLETLNSAAKATGSAGTNGTLLNFPQLRGTGTVAKRLSPKEALENLQVLEQLQRWLGTNVQEALALEVGLLKLRL